MKKIITALLLSSICAASFAKEVATANPEINNKDTIVIKLSHVVAPESPKGKASIKFKEIMEKKFPGKVKVELYDNNKLFKDKEETEALELGIVDVILPTFGKISSEYSIKELSVFDLPFLFSSDQEVKNYMESPIGHKLLNLVSEKTGNLTAIAYWPNAFRSFHGPVAFHTPADFKNYSFRVENPAISNFYKALGAKQTVQLAFSDLPKALKKQGEFKLDGSENPLSNFYNSKLYESQPVITLSRHSYIGYMFLVNNRFLNTLPKDVKEELVVAANEAGEYGRQVAMDSEKQVLKDIEAKGVKIYTWTPEERKAFKVAAIPVHEKFMKQSNKDFLLQTYQAIK
jgi:C4-dicarboxylate-binding protein DctP